MASEDILDLVDLLAGREEELKGKRVPLTCVTELTHACNEKCRHCYIDDHSKPLFLEPNTYEKVCRGMAERGGLFVILSGGEPLIHPAFETIYCMTRDYGLIPFIFTNTIALDGRLMRLFAKRPPAKIEVSVYGAEPSTHDFVTRIPGSFEKTWANLLALRQLGIRLTVKSVLMKANAHEMQRLRSMAEQQLGAEFRCQVYISPTLDGNRENLLLETTPEEREQITLSVLPTRCRTRLEPPWSGNLRCGAGLYSFLLDPTGHVSGCMYLRDLKADLAHVPFSDIWDDLLPYFRAYFDRKTPVCPECEVREACAPLACYRRRELETTGKLDRVCELARLVVAIEHSNATKGGELSAAKV